MSKRNTNDAAESASDLTSAGVPWSEVPDFAVAEVESIDGRHGTAKDNLPSVEEIPIPDILFFPAAAARETPARIERHARCSWSQVPTPTLPARCLGAEPSDRMEVGEMAERRSWLATGRCGIARLPSRGIAQ